MKDKKIGQIILKGGSIIEIQKEFPEFPENPTKEYFIEKGYKESTAKRYINLLKRNSQNMPLKEMSAQKVEKTLPDSNTKQTQFIASKNADYENLLVDTCALAHSETTNLIEEAKHVTFIYSTIEEIDKQKKHPKLKHNIQLYTEKALLDPEKYMSSRFSGCFNDKYPDNILLQYMMILPKQIRPTLITADKNLAFKADALELPYILFLVNTKNANKTVREFGYGLKLVSTNDGEMYIEYKGNQPLFILREKKEIPFYGTRQQVFPGDSLLLKEKIKRKIVEHNFEI